MVRLRWEDPLLRAVFLERLSSKLIDTSQALQYGCCYDQGYNDIKFCPAGQNFEVMSRKVKVDNNTVGHPTVIVKHPL
jgi:hypothetical protein